MKTEKEITDKIKKVYDMMNISTSEIEIVHISGAATALKWVLDKLEKPSKFLS